MAWTLRRKAARVVLLDRQGRVLLLRASDPTDAGKPPWWELPGGGLEGSETSEQAASRELREEAGITDVEMGPCVWTQHAVFDFAGFHFDQHERIHVAWCDGGVVRPTRLEHLEAMAFDGGRWWSLDELGACDDRLIPADLRALLPPLIAGDLPVDPIDITPAVP